MWCILFTDTPGKRQASMGCFFDMFSLMSEIIESSLIKIVFCNALWIWDLLLGVMTGETFEGNRTTVWKVSKYGVFSGPYFPVFRVNLRIQSEYRKIRTRKNSIFGYFSCCGTVVSIAVFEVAGITFFFWNWNFRGHILLIMVVMKPFYLVI